MLKTLILSILILFSLKTKDLKLTQVTQVTSKVTKIYAQITKNHPKLDKNYATRLAIAIESKTTKYKLSPTVFTAMLMQESGYRIDAKNIVCGRSVSTGKSDCVVQDWGVGQINRKTVKAFKFDQKRLITDLEYSIEAAALVLANFKKAYGTSDKEYWTRYNSGVSSKRHFYKRLVTRYF
jgi:soluble lytic murein transglycosylase-like protein